MVIICSNPNCNQFIDNVGYRVANVLHRTADSMDPPGGDYERCCNGERVARNVQHTVPHEVAYMTFCDKTCYELFKSKVSTFTSTHAPGYVHYYDQHERTVRRKKKNSATNEDTNSVSDSDYVIVNDEYE